MSYEKANIDALAQTYIRDQKAQIVNTVFVINSFYAHKNISKILLS
jgi:hypothetical protein